MEKPVKRDLSVRIKYPAVAIYKIVDAWVDGLVEDGLITEKGTGVTRGRVGDLNSAIRRALEEHNLNL